MKDKYTNFNVQDAEITIEYKYVAWKWNNNEPIATFKQEWYDFSYQWQSRYSNLILNLDPNMKMVSRNLLENECLADDDDNDDDEEDNDDLKANNRYLVVFGQNGNIAVLDTHKLEWHLSKYKLPLDGNVNSLIDENGFLYLLSQKIFSRYYVVSGEKFTATIDKMVHHNNALDDIAMVLFKNAWLHRRSDRYFDWKHIYDHKLAHFRRLFHDQLTESSSSCQPALVILWEVVKGDKDAIPMVSKWIRRDDLMRNIHIFYLIIGVGK